MACACKRQANRLINHRGCWHWWFADLGIHLPQVSNPQYWQRCQFLLQSIMLLLFPVGVNRVGDNGSVLTGTSGILQSRSAILRGVSSAIGDDDMCQQTGDVFAVKQSFPAP